MDKNNGNSMLTVGILWILVVGMCFGGQFFYGKIKTTISPWDIRESVSYDFAYDGNNKIIYELPKSWRATENMFCESQDVLYFVDFDGIVDKIYGDIKVIKSDLTLQDIIHKRTKDLNKNSNILKCESVSSNDIKKNSFKIYYKLENVHGILTEHEEYYIDINNNYLRVSFSKLTGNFNSDDYKYINNVISNIRKK